MGKYFGTDGIREKTEMFSEKFVFSVGDALVKVLNKPHLKIIIGGDTRTSTSNILDRFIAILSYHGVEIINVDIMPTPVISFLVEKYQCDAGIVITASHNPSTYNGIKIINNEGEKLSDEMIKDIEEHIDCFSLNDLGVIRKVKINSYHDEALMYYRDYLLNLFDCDFSGLSIGIDCANGATAVTYDIFKKLNANIVVVNNNKNYNDLINQNCGSMHMEVMEKLVLDNELDFGIAFDGDGDRSLFIDNLGNLIDGDHIMAIIGLYLKENNKLAESKIVTTVMANQGLFNFAAYNEIDLVITDVGDSNVYEAMKNEHLSLGGEQSGHIILPSEKMGDGLITALTITKIIKEKDISLFELSKTLKKSPQVIKNIPASISHKEKFKNDSSVKEIIEMTSKALEKYEGRLLARASGTEELIRLTMWGNDLDIITDLVEKLATSLEDILY